MRSIISCSAALLILVVASDQRSLRAQSAAPANGGGSLSDARRGFQTKLTKQLAENEAPDEPPAGVLDLVHYESPAGSLAAYLTHPPQDGKKHPAIIWIFGGFDNGIGATAWQPADPSNDQSARAFREAGVITMYPSFRGGNKNPGYKERLLGEVDDVLAAEKFLVRQGGVDPSAIYLGGHSTGGTLALLCAEMPNSFRAVFAFGPVDDVRRYGTKDAPFNRSDAREVKLRSPIYWLSSVYVSTFVFEGTEKPSNLLPLKMLRRATKNPLIHFYAVDGKTHFSTLAAVTPIVAREILQASTKPISFKQDGLTELPAN